MSMSGTIQTGPLSARFNHDGYERLDDVFDLESIAELRADFPGQLMRTSKLVRFSRHPMLASLARQALGPESRVINATYFEVAQGNGVGPRYRDDQYFELDAGQLLTCIVALDDVTDSSGAFVVAPGGGDATARTVAMRAGSVLMCADSLTRYTNPNRNDEAAVYAVFQYCSAVDLPTPLPGFAHGFATLLPSTDRVSVVANGRFVAFP